MTIVKDVCSKCGELKDCVPVSFETKDKKFTENICFDCLIPYAKALNDILETVA